MRKKMMGGGMMQRPMYKKGGVATEAKKKQFKANKAGQKVTNKKAMKVAKGVLKLTPVGFGIAAADTVKRIKKMGGGMMKRPMYKDGSPKKEKGAEIGGEAGFKFMNEKKGLKPVKPNQKGLKKLPTEVRNKMGFMKKGGKVNGK